MVLDPKNTGKDITDDVRDWNLFFVFGMVSVLYIHYKNLGLQTAKGSSAAFRLNLTSVATAMFLGMMAQGLIFDHLCSHDLKIGTSKGWIYQARYFKELVAAPAPSKTAPLVIHYGTHFAAYMMEGLIALAALGCVIDLVAYGTVLRSLISGAGVAAGGFVYQTMLVPSYIELRELATKHKGKANAAAKEAATIEQLDFIKDLHLQIVMGIGAFLLVQLLFSRFSIPQPAEQKENKSEKKTN